MVSITIIKSISITKVNTINQKYDSSHNNQDNVILFNLQLLKAGNKCTNLGL